MADSACCETMIAEDIAYVTRIRDWARAEYAATVRELEASSERVDSLGDLMRAADRVLRLLERDRL